MKHFPFREIVPAAKRKAMTRARKRRLWEACNGICIQCGEAVEMYGPTVRYDHELALELGGSDDDSNIGPIHRSPCDLIKTASDAAKIAEMRRQQKMRLDVPRREPRLTGGRKLESRNEWPTGQKFPKRQFFGGRKPA